MIPCRNGWKDDAVYRYQDTWHLRQAKAGWTWLAGISPGIQPCDVKAPEKTEAQARDVSVGVYGGGGGKDAGGGEYKH